MTISVEPSVKIILGAVMVVSSAAVGFGAQFTTLAGDHTASMIVAACTITTGVCGGLISFLGAASSSTPGPLAKDDSDAIKAMQLKEQLAQREAPAPGAH
jgi:hypothetical protein